MKKVISLLIGLFILSSGLVKSQDANSGNKQSQEGVLNVLSSPDIYPLTAKWASEYGALNPKLKINVITIKENGSDNIFDAGADIGFVTGAYTRQGSKEEMWKITVGRDVVVPVISSVNPFLAEINNSGVSPDRLAKFFTQQPNKNWGMLLENGQNVQVKTYLIDNESVKNQVASFFGLKQNAIDGIKVSGAKELISALQNDPGAIGFCRLTDIIDPVSQNIVESIRLLPIDKNGNGIMDYKESIYENLTDFSRGLWVGKYPKSLINNIYSISSVQPANVVEVSFVKWVLTDGQQYLGQFGHSDLLLSERQALADQLDNGVITTDVAKGGNSIMKALLIILAIVIVGGYILTRVVLYFLHKKETVPAAASFHLSGFNEQTVLAPKGLFYDKTHTWAFMDENGAVKVGIDDFLQHVTGSLTRVEMKKPGEKIRKGEKLMAIIQNGKQLELYAPVSGTILEQNQKLASDTSLLNSAPYTEGWVYTVEPSNWLKEISLMSMAEKYTAWLKSEINRLRDFIAVTFKADTVEYSHIILQDGGEIKDHLLEDMGPETWEDFQTKFLDTSK